MKVLGLGTHKHGPGFQGPSKAQLGTNHAVASLPSALDAGEKTVSALLANMSRRRRAAKNMLLPKLGLCPTVTPNCEERSHIINII